MIVNREYIKAIKSNLKLPFPYLVQLEITNSCPFSCPQCYKETSQIYHMDFDKLKELVTICYNNGTNFFVLNGGEPLLYYKIKELLAFMNTMNIRMNCFTSGYGLTEDIINSWNFNNHRLCLSLNGSTETINSLTRQGYNVTISAMERLSKLKKNYGINWVARHDNLMDMQELIHLCEKLSVGFLFITSEKLTGTGMIMSPLNKADYLFLFDFIKSYSGSVKIIIEACFPTLHTLMQDNNKSNYFIGCFAGKYGCCVNANFEFSPCTHLAYYEKYESLMDYWNNSAILQQLNRSNESSHCNYCMHHLNCNPCKAWDRRMYKMLSGEFSSCPLFVSI